MAPNLSRNYNCKDEELPVICKFLAFSLKRDLAGFTAYSPRFNQEYVTGFETKTTLVTELVEPKSETVELKTITERLYKTMDSLVTSINHLTGYVDMAKETINISPADFGLKALRKGINTKDAENVIKNLHTVNTNITKYKEALTVQGLSEELTGKFAAAVNQVADDKQKQYEIISNRKTIVQNNLSLLNGLFDQLSEILAVGKILNKGVDAVKLQEYTFNELKKRVRRTAKPTNGTTEPPAEPTNPETTGA